MVLSAILDPLFYFLAGPHIPPGTMTDTAQGAQFDFNVLFVMALPVLLAVWIYLVYAIVMWRASRGGPEPVGGPAARGHLGIQAGLDPDARRSSCCSWPASAPTSSCSLAGRVAGRARARSGHRRRRRSCPSRSSASSGSSPTATRPSAGSRPTSSSSPNDTTIEFNVTSLDVIHSFWAYQLGVKADANPDYNNVAYTTTQQLGSFIVRCAELCGIWHGAMYNSGVVVTPQQFEGWAKLTAVRLRQNTKLLPAYALTYTPDANGADGSYYPDNVDPYSNVEQYGAPQPKGGG